MICRNLYPILEFDDAPDAVINPSSVHPERLEWDRMVITFFPEIIERLLSEGAIRPCTVVSGENPIQIYGFSDEPDVYIVLGQCGCPACAGNLDLFHEMGIERVMFCGGGGVLDRSIGVGQLLLVDGAIRDEGFSYHYIEPSRIMPADEKVNARIAAHLEENGIPYLRGLTWTTDAIFRETSERVEMRRKEGAKIVEMEQSGCLAVAKFRGFRYGALIYGGDDVSGSEWDNRQWRSRNGVRYDLVMLCKRLTALI